MFEEVEDYAILLLDELGNIETWNKGAEHIKGYRAAEIIGQNFRLFYSASDQKNGLPDKLMRTALEKGKATHEGWRVKKDGSRFWGYITITAIRNEDNQHIGFSKVTRDLTEKREQEQFIREYSRQLEQKNRELEQFVYVASHDLQEPLLTVTNFINLFKEEYGDALDENALTYLKYINQSSERMKELIRGLLEYARLGRKSDQLQTVDCNIVMQDVCSDLFASIQKHNAAVNYKGLPVITGDKTQIRQLFQNLVSNALKFSKSGVDPIVVVSAVETDEGWKFSVQDNGIGMESRYLEKIFIIFQRLNTRSEFEGNGIGLAQCKKIVELHRGKIWVESEPGKGSVFWFTLNKIGDEKI
ncbi:MAG: PAS domain S-box protein [Chryseobacterium sp.]|nr:MAG: PAS domain S-box protein [Chryseobacterium sp.]